MNMQRKTQFLAGHIDTEPEEALVDSGNVSGENVVIIPTYNEAGNLKRLIPSILEQGSFDILIIDDNSPDGTGELAEEFAHRFPGRVSVLHRPGKLGLGTAYLAGFDYVLAMGYQQVFTMDADFSHDPSRLPALRAALDHDDVVLGSRYVPGGGSVHWPLLRRILSRGGSTYARLILGLRIRDLTGGFKGFRRQVLESLLPELETIRSRGYAFQIEMTYRCARHGYSIVEVPIVFEDRLVGTSKMNRRIVAEALWVVWALRLSQGSARPHRQGRPARRSVMATVMGLGSLIFFLGIVAMIPKGISYLLAGVSGQPASQSQSVTSHHTRPSPAATHVAARTLSATLQLQGTNLTSNVPLLFAGSGFLPGEALAVTIQDQAGHVQAQLAPLNADNTGQFSTATEAIPVDLPPGAHVLLVQGQSSQRTAQASFQVALIPPTVQLDAYTVKPRHDIGFAGSGFLPNEVVEVRLGTTGQALAQVLATVNANAGGNIVGRFTVPLMPGGNYTLFVVGRQSQTPTTVGLTVQAFHPWVLLDSYAPSSHTRLGFTGEDFVPNEEVLVYLNQRKGEPVVRMQADTNGRFVMPAAWEVVNLTGENTLIFVGQQSGAVITTTFTVVP